MIGSGSRFARKPQRQGLNTIKTRTRGALGMLENAIASPEQFEDQKENMIQNYNGEDFDHINNLILPTFNGTEHQNHEEHLRQPQLV